jgi:flagellar biosynthesis protein FlhF
VILSNRAVSGGVEILALAQGDVAGFVAPQAAQRPVFAAQPAFESRRVPARRAEPKPNPAATLKEFAQRIDQAASPAPAPAAQADAGKLFAEIKAMRGDLDRQLANLAWNEGARRRPLRAKLMREMLAAGLSAPLGRKVSAGLPDDYSEGEARKWLRAVLAKNLHCDTEADNLVSRGGVYALVGPTGVGKTTTVAKLAARCVVRFGAHKLALVSTDSYRIGAQDQLAIYARILGVQVHAAQDAAGLERVLQSLGDRHMVLIDTVGMGQRDTRVAEQLALVGGKKVQRILLLNAAAQLETLEDVIRVYKGSTRAGTDSFAGAIITKLDESRRPGCALDAAMRHKLKLAFVTDGQRVPEDIRLPVAAPLVESALAAAVDSPFALDDDELMLLGGRTAGGA